MLWLCFSLYFLIETIETLVMILCDEQPALFCAAAEEPQVGGGAAGGRRGRIDLVAETQ